MQQLQVHSLPLGVQHSCGESLYLLLPVCSCSLLYTPGHWVQPVGDVILHFLLFCRLPMLLVVPSLFRASFSFSQYYPMHTALAV